MRKSNKVLSWIHQLPQNSLGSLTARILKAETKHANTKFGYIEIQSVKHNVLVSLGDYIIVNESHSMTDVLHEYGHSLQSKKLGWLYLLIIGLPSFIGALAWKIRKFDYFSLPWERWADKLGGVNR